MGDGPNIRLQAARSAMSSRSFPNAPMSRAELAELVNAYVLEHFGVRGAMTSKSLGRLESGKVRWPNARYRAALRAILGASDDAELGFVAVQRLRAAAQPTATLLNLPWNVVGAVDALRAVTEEPPMNRRDFLHGALGGAAFSQIVAFEWLFALPAGAVARNGTLPVTDLQVDAVEGAIAGLRRMDDTVGSGNVYRLATSQLQGVFMLLRDGRYSDSIGRRLLAVAAELEQFVGWLCRDSGRYAQARQHWAASLHAAHAAGDDQIAANVLSFWSCQLVDAGEAGVALSLAQAAVQRLDGSPRVRGLAHLSQAVAFGALGELDHCRRAIDDAHDALAVVQDGQPDYAYWVPGGFADMAGLALFYAGRHSEAIDYLGPYVAGPVGARERARGATELARAYAAFGDPDEAGRIGTEAIDMLEAGVASTRTVTDLRRLDADLSDFDTAAVDEFRERLFTFSST